MSMRTLTAEDLEKLVEVRLPALTPLRTEGAIDAYIRPDQGVIITLSEGMRHQVIALVDKVADFRGSIVMQDSLFAGRGPIAHELVTPVKETRRKVGKLLGSFQVMHMGAIADVESITVPRDKKKHPVTVSRVTNDKASLVVNERESGYPVTLELAGGSRLFAFIDPSHYPSVFASGATHAVLQGRRIDLFEK